MNFDPAIVAWRVFRRVQSSAELGEDLDAAVAAQERFSTGAGDEAAEAYRELVAIGARHPEAAEFGEFLVYTTWSHLMDETSAEHFRRGVALCQTLLQRDSGGDPDRLARLQAMEHSFRAGLGERADDDADFDADNVKGGD